MSHLMTPLQTALRAELKQHYKVTQSALYTSEAEVILSRVIARLVRDEAAIEATMRGICCPSNTCVRTEDGSCARYSFSDEARAALLAWAAKVGAGG